MEKVILEKYIYRPIIITKADLGPLKVVNPVATCILHRLRKIVGNSRVVFDFRYKDTWHS